MLDNTPLYPDQSTAADRNNPSANEQWTAAKANLVKARIIAAIDAFNALEADIQALETRVGTALSDNVPPIIQLFGGSVITLTQGDTFTEPGYEASDVDARGQTVDLTSQVQPSGSVNVNTVGDYILNYTVQDAAEPPNSVTVTRTIRVVAPVIAPNLAVTPTLTGTNYSIALETDQQATIKYAVVETDKIAGLTDDELIKIIDFGQKNSAPEFKNLNIYARNNGIATDAIFYDADGDASAGPSNIRKIQRSDNGVTGWSDIADMPGTPGAVYALAAVDEGKHYRYRVLARATNGIRQGSIQYSPSLQWYLPLAAPTNISFTNLTHEGGTANWTSNMTTQDNTQIRIYKKGATPPAFTDLAPGTEIENFATLTQLTDYVVEVREIKNGNTSATLTGEFRSAVDPAGAPYNTASDLASLQAGTSDRFKLGNNPGGTNLRVPKWVAGFPRAFYDNPTQKFKLVVQLGGDGQALGNDASDSNVYNKAFQFGYLKEMKADAGKEFDAIVFCPLYKYPGGTTEQELADLIHWFRTQYPDRIDLSKVAVYGLSKTAYQMQALAGTLSPTKATHLVIIAKKNSNPFDANNIKDVAVWAISNQEGADLNSTIGAYNEIKNAAGRTAPTKLTIFQGTGHNAWNKVYAEASVTLDSSLSENSPLNPPTVLDWIENTNVQAPAAGAPGVPALTATPNGQTTINVTAPNAANAARYILNYRIQGDSTWIAIGGNSLNPLNYAHTGLTADTTYEYRAKSVNTDGVESDYSATVTAKTAAASTGGGGSFRDVGVNLGRHTSFQNGAPNDYNNANDDPAVPGVLLTNLNDFNEVDTPIDVEIGVGFKGFLSVGVPTAKTITDKDGNPVTFSATVLARAYESSPSALGSLPFKSLDPTKTYRVFTAHIRENASVTFTAEVQVGSQVKTITAGGTNNGQIIEWDDITGVSELTYKVNQITNANNLFYTNAIIFRILD